LALLHPDVMMVANKIAEVICNRILISMFALILIWFAPSPLYTSMVDAD
jgi:hypothetical protein